MGAGMSRVFEAGWVERGEGRVVDLWGWGLRRVVGGDGKGSENCKFEGRSRFRNRRRMMESES